MLYHYTDYFAFDGIIGSREMRLNNVLNMNDTAEMRFYMNGICQAVTEKLIEQGDTEKASVMNHFFQNEFAEEFNYSAYAACFSHYRDDAAQWERYGKGGQGICISFDQELLKKLTQTTHGALSLRRVRYGLNFKELEIVDRFYQLVSNTDSLADCIDEFQDHMIEAWVTSAAFKHPSFANENEVRMVFTPTVSEFQVKPCYQISGSRIKKYYPVDLGQMCTNAGISMDELIREVTIGPTSTQSPAILKDYLQDKGYKRLLQNILISECPLTKPNS